MAQIELPSLVGREAPLGTLRDLYDNLDGASLVMLGGRDGSGRRSLVGHFLADLPQDGTWIAARVGLESTDDAVRCLLKVWGSVMAGVHGSGAARGTCVDLLKGAADKAEAREANWLNGFAENLESLPSQSTGANMQLRLPRDNPYMGLLEVIRQLSKGMTLVLEVRQLMGVTSAAFWIFLGALMGLARKEGWRLLVILEPGTSPYDEGVGSESGPGVFLKEIAEGWNAEVMALAPLTEEQVGQLIDDRFPGNGFPKSFADQLHALTEGHPGDIIGVLETLKDGGQLGSAGAWVLDDNLGTIDWATVVPVPSEDGGGDEAGTTELARRLLWTGALEGEVFSSGLLSVALGVDKDKVDDALDELEDLVEEIAYIKALDTWTYRFRRTYVWRWYRQQAQTLLPEGAATRLARVMLERYATRVFDYLPKAAQLFQDQGQAQVARNLLALSMGGERPELMNMGLELMEATEPELLPLTLPRMVWTNLSDRATNQGPIEQARELVNRGRLWARSAGDIDSIDYFTLMDSRLQMRAGNVAASKELAQEALAGFDSRGSKTRAAAAHNQLATVALQAAELETTRSHTDQAAGLTSSARVLAHTHFIQGVLSKRTVPPDREQGRKLIEGGIVSFAQAADLATQIGNLPLAMEAAMNLGEALLVVGRPADAVPSLERALQLSEALGAKNRAHLAARMLGQALMTSRLPGAQARAYPVGQRALALAEELGVDTSLHIDLYHAGIFALALGKAEEATGHLLRAEKRAKDAGDEKLLREVRMNLAGAHARSKKFDEARSLWQSALEDAEKAGDANVQAMLLQSLARVDLQTRDSESALALLTRGLGLVKKEGFADPLHRLEASFHEIAANAFVQQRKIPSAVERLQLASGLLKGTENKEVRRRLRGRLEELQRAHAN